MIIYCLHIIFIFSHSGLYYGSPWGPHIFSVCRLGGMFYEVKGPIPRPELTHRIPRIEWIVMTPMRCQVLSSAIMRPTPSRGPNGVSLLACRCNNIGASGGLITLVAILTYPDLDYTCEWGGIYMTGTVGDYSVMMVTIVPMVP